MYNVIYTTNVIRDKENEKYSWCEFTIYSGIKKNGIIILITIIDFLHRFKL